MNGITIKRLGNLELIMRLKSFLFLLIVVGLKLSGSAQKVQNLLSPNERLQFQFYQKELQEGKTQMYYHVSYDGKSVILDSELGVLIENNLFESALAIENDPSDRWCENLDLVSMESRSVDDEWEPLYGERRVIQDHYNEMTLHLEKFGNHGDNEDNKSTGTSYDRRRTYEMDLIIRAYDGGIAFRYSFPETKNGLFLHIEGEQTSFVFPENTMAYYERWAQGPYEYLPLDGWTEESERPLTLELDNGLKVALLEAQMVDYSRGKFQLTDRNTLKLSMYDKVDVITPYATPWRVIMVAETGGALVGNNDIIRNLNPPNKLKNTSWIKPGKVIRSDLTTTEAKECVDFALERNLQYVHLDAGWYGKEMLSSSDATTIDPNRDLDLYELVNYASDKGIGIFLYINQRALAEDLDNIFAQCREWGIKGVKFGFVQIGSNRWTVWMHDAVKKAAEYQLMVDIHDEYRPTGFSRTYPNLMTQEGIRGNEEMPDATHNTILPFTRFLAGPGDYTICYYNNRIKTTHAHQLALSVVYYSPLQFLYWYGKPSLYRGEKEIEFYDKVPTVWDETKVLDGEIGEYVITARKSGEEWFVGAITNNDAREIEIDFDFLPKGKKFQARLYQDDASVKSRTNVSLMDKSITSKTKMKLPLKASGGVAVWIKEL